MAALYSIFMCCNFAYDNEALNFFGIISLSNAFLNILIHLSAMIITGSYDIINKYK